MNIAARAGAWSAAHWKTATLGWLVFVAAALVLGSTVGTRTLTNAEQSQGGSARAEAILARAGFVPPAAEGVLLHSASARPGDPAFEATTAELVSALRRMPEVGRVKRTVVSKDGRSELVSFDVAGKPDTADTRIQPVLDRVAAVQRAHPAFTLQEIGDASANRAANDVIAQDLKKAEITSVPVTFAILLFAFGAFVAAGLPVLLALSAVLSTVGLGAVVSHASSDSAASTAPARVVVSTSMRRVIVLRACRPATTARPRAGHLGQKYARVVTAQMPTKKRNSVIAAPRSIASARVRAIRRGSPLSTNTVHACTASGMPSDMSVHSGQKYARVVAAQTTTRMTFRPA
ncbi:MAG: MMPL family transporter [Gaiellaceae bacterium]